MRTHDRNTDEDVLDLSYEPSDTDLVCELPVEPAADVDVEAAASRYVPRSDMSSYNSQTNWSSAPANAAPVRALLRVASGRQAPSTSRSRCSGGTAPRAA